MIKISTYIYIYIYRKTVFRFFRSRVLVTLKQSVIHKYSKQEKTTLSSRQACFVIAHSSRDFNNKNIHNHRLYTLRLRCCRCIISSSSSYNSSSKRCNLCLKEKFLIIGRPDLSSLNKRNELVSSCRHRNKALLRNKQTFKFKCSPTT